MDLGRAVSEFVTMGRTVFSLLRTERNAVSTLDLHVLRAQLHVLLAELVSIELENGQLLKTSLLEIENELTRWTPARHEAEFYDNDASWMESILPFVKIGLELRETVIVIATPVHTQTLQLALPVEDLSNDRLRFFDPTQLVDRFLVRGRPSVSKFLDVIKPLMCKIRGHRVRIFNEMAGVLWDRNGRDAALRLEQLWSSLGGLHQYSVLCSYSESAFRGIEGRRDQVELSRIHREAHRY